MEGLVAPSKLYGMLAAGRPIAVMCEPRSYLQALVAEAGCGAAFNNGDGASLAEFIRRLAVDPQLAQQMGKAGRYYLQSHFTPEIIAKQYSKLLHRVVLAAQQRSYSLKPKAVPRSNFAPSSSEIFTEDTEI
jgi:glycosyltransferase involved in cell wall biosynthesis